MKIKNVKIELLHYTLLAYFLLMIQIAIFITFMYFQLILTQNDYCHLSSYNFLVPARQIPSVLQYSKYKQGTTLYLLVNVL